MLTAVQVSDHLQLRRSRIFKSTQWRCRRKVRSIWVGRAALQRLRNTRCAVTCHRSHQWATSSEWQILHLAVSFRPLFWDKRWRSDRTKWTKRIVPQVALKNLRWCPVLKNPWPITPTSNHKKKSRSTSRCSKVPSIVKLEVLLSIIGTRLIIQWVMTIHSLLNRRKRSRKQGLVSGHMCRIQCQRIP